MARRKTNRNNAVGVGKGKAAQKRRDLRASARNRASPKPIIKLYDKLTPAQRDVIIAMGHGTFLDIKCKELHNPIILWFPHCYDPGRRSFVVPCRGVIPLTEESVHIMLGAPRGQLAVKYYVDYKFEAEVAGRLFPGGNSRPNVSDIGKMIEQYKEADDTFKELWMLYIVSTVVAPTTDTKMSNSCYPMLADIAQANEMNFCKFVVDGLHRDLSNKQYNKGCLLYCMLRYLDALDTDHLVLELADANFAINAWAKDAVDAIGALDAQEYDSTIFGKMELKHVYKDDLVREMGLFCGSDGFDAWTKLNTHPTCS